VIKYRGQTSNLAKEAVASFQILTGKSLRSSTCLQDEQANLAALRFAELLQSSDLLRKSTIENAPSNDEAFSMVTLESSVFNSIAVEIVRWNNTIRNISPRADLLSTPSLT
jgi:hypothetical protein